MPTAFFAGEAEKYALGIPYVSFYSGAASLAALLVAPYAGDLLAVSRARASNVHACRGDDTRLERVEASA